MPRRAQSFVGYEQSTIGVLGIERTYEASREAAHRLAAEGAELARQAGFDAEPRESTQLDTIAGVAARGQNGNRCAVSCRSKLA